MEPDCKRIWLPRLLMPCHLSLCNLISLRSVFIWLIFWHGLLALICQMKWNQNHSFQASECCQIFQTIPYFSYRQSSLTLWFFAFRFISWRLNTPKWLRLFVQAYCWNIQRLGCREWPSNLKFSQDKSNYRHHLVFIPLHFASSPLQFSGWSHQAFRCVQLSKC